MSRAALVMAELACRIQRANPALLPCSVVGIAARLTRLAASYQRLQETACNRELTQREKAREKSLEAKLNDELFGLGLTVSFSGDPRGYVVKLHGIGDNTWGQDGWGIG